MYNEPDARLNKLKQSYDSIPVSLDSLDAAITAGFQKAKNEEKKKRVRFKVVYSFVAAAVVLLGFFATVRVSPAFANAVANLPGMEKIVEMIKFDKGKMSAVENDYYEKINASLEKNGVKVTIDGIIADEKGMMVFYTLTSKEKEQDFDLKDANITSLEGNYLDPGTLMYGDTYDEEGRTTYSGELEFYFDNKIEGKKFQIELLLADEKYSIPFTLHKNRKVAKTYDINQTVELDGQKIEVVSAEVTPLRTAVHVRFDRDNSKQIFELEGLRIVDEKGEMWGNINGGVTASLISDNERIIYLQSNYFHKPKELYVVLDHVQAVDKDETTVVVDTEKLVILKQPAGNILQKVRKEDNFLMFTLNVKDFGYNPFGEMLDANGEAIDFRGGFSTRSSGNEIGMELPPAKLLKNPLSIKLDAFPSWLKGEAKVRIK